MRFHFEDWFSHFIACFVTFLLLAQHCVICWNLIMTRRRQLCGWYSIESSLYMSIWFVKYNIREEILVTENGTRNYVIFNASFLTIYKTVPHWLYIILQTHTHTALELMVSKLRPNSWRNSLMIGFYPAVNSCRHALLSLYSPSGKTSYRKILSGLKATRSRFKLSQ